MPKTSGCRATVQGSSERVRGPWAGKQMQFRAQSRTSPAAAGTRRGSLALLSPKGGSWEKGLASFTIGAWVGGGRAERAISAILSLQICPSCRDPCPPTWGSPGPRVAACQLQVTSPGAPPFTPFLLGRRGRGVRRYLLCAELKVCNLRRKSPLLPPAHNLPDPREIQEEALMIEGW